MREQLSSTNEGEGWALDCLQWPRPATSRPTVTPWRWWTTLARSRSGSEKSTSSRSRRLSNVTESGPGNTEKEIRKRKHFLSGDRGQSEGQESGKKPQVSLSGSECLSAGRRLVDVVSKCVSGASILCLHVKQGAAKRCRLSWLTNSTLVYEPNCGGREGVAGSQPMSTAAVHRSPNKLWRSNSIFNQWCQVSPVYTSRRKYPRGDQWRVSCVDWAIIGGGTIFRVFVRLRRTKHFFNLGQFFLILFNHIWPLYIC